MSSLTLIEKKKLEQALGMASGFVLNFSNRTFEEFFREIVGVDICDQRYDYGSNSKANRMRAFWATSTDEQVGLLLEGLVKAWEFYSDDGSVPEAASNTIKEILIRIGRNPSSTGASSEDKTLTSPSHEVARLLTAELLSLSKLAPQQRGYAFERFLYKLFDAYGLSPRGAFRLAGEQIDGSFELNKEIYLLEAKWQNAPTGARDLHTFEGKLGERAAWSRGLFISNSGFTEEGLRAFGRGKRLVCMDGFDLSELLLRQHSLAAVLEAKVRKAVESGEPYTPVRNLF